MIYTIIRFLSAEELEWYLEECLSLKQKFPDYVAGQPHEDRQAAITLTFIKGFDVVGPEDTMRPLIDYVEPLLAFREKCDSMGVDLPFIFHAGETLGDGE